LANINQLLLDYKGYSFNQKIINDCNKIILENKSKVLGYLPRPAEISLVTVLDKNKKEILDIGASEPNDLILDVFSNVIIELGGRTNNLVIQQRDTSGVLQNIKGKGSIQNWYNFAITTSTGTRIGIGSGLTPPARTDFNLTTPFGVAPESGFTNTTIGGYNSGLGQVSAGSTIGATGGAGTVNETILLTFWTDPANIARAFAIAHDLISPAPSFGIGNFVNVVYTWQI